MPINILSSSKRMSIRNLSIHGIIPTGTKVFAFILTGSSPGDGALPTGVVGIKSDGTAAITNDLSADLDVPGEAQYILTMNYTTGTATSDVSGITLSNNGKWLTLDTSSTFGITPTSTPLGITTTVAGSHLNQKIYAGYPYKLKTSSINNFQSYVMFVPALFSNVSLSIDGGAGSATITGQWINAWRTANNWIFIQGTTTRSIPVSPGWMTTGKMAFFMTSTEASLGYYYTYTDSCTNGGFGACPSGSTGTVCTIDYTASIKTAGTSPYTCSPKQTTSTLPVWKTWWFWTIIGVTLLIIIGAIFFFVSASSKKKKELMAQRALMAQQYPYGYRMRS